MHAKRQHFAQVTHNNIRTGEVNNNVRFGSFNRSNQVSSYLNAVTQRHGAFLNIYSTDKLQISFAIYLFTYLAAHAAQRAIYQNTNHVVHSLIIKITVEIFPLDSISTVSMLNNIHTHSRDSPPLQMQRQSGSFH